MNASVGSPLLWAVFGILVAIMMVLDLGVFHRKAHEVSFREALTWVIVWVGLALLFNGWIFWKIGSRSGLEFFTGYVIEYALSVDNIFVFLLVLSFFKVPGVYQHRVIFWGIVGALLMRGIFIFAGTSLLHRFAWLVYLFGGFLIVTGIKTLQGKLDQHDPARSPAYRLAAKYLRATPDFHGSKFFVRIDGSRYVTPLFIVLLVIEFTDLVFAVDSVPAVLAITRDPFIVYTSNIFAILGLRSLYFLLSGAMGKIHYLKLGLGLVLIFVGIKMVIADFFKIPIVLSLTVVVGILTAAIIASAIRKRRRNEPI
ncbi:MAG: TerC family protein [Pseudomonadota bacterium]